MFSRSQRFIDGYRNTAYVVQFGGRFVAIRRDCWQPAVDQVLASHHARTAVFITAFNPFSRSSDRIVNARNHRRLMGTLRQRGISFIVAKGISERDEAEPERGVLVFRLSRARAAALGRALRQNAIIYVRIRRPAAVQCLF